MDLATLARHDAILDRLVRALLQAPNGLPQQQLADEVYRGKPESNLQALSRKLSSLPEVTWIERVRQPDRSKIVRLSALGRRSALGASPTGPDLFRKGRLIERLDHLSFHQGHALSRSHVYLLIALRSFSRSDAVDELPADELDALLLAVSALLGRGEPGRPPEVRGAAGRLAGLVLELIDAMPGANQPTTWDGDRWTRLYDLCWSLRDREMAPALRSVWAGAASMVAVAFGGTRWRQDQRVRLQSAVADVLERDLREDLADPLPGMLLRHWSAVVADSMGLTNAARAAWGANERWQPASNTQQDHQQCTQIAIYSRYNAARVGHEHARDRVMRRLLSRCQLLQPAGAGPLSLEESQHLAQSLRDPWQRPLEADVQEAHRVELAPPSPDVALTPQLKDDTAAGTVTGWFAEMDALGERPARFVPERLAHLDDLSLNNFFSCGTAIAHVYAGSTTTL